MAIYGEQDHLRGSDKGKQINYLQLIFKLFFEFVKS